MTRRLRIQYPGLMYHVSSRGNGKMRVFLDDAENNRFLDLLGEACEIYHVECHAYSLMVNHYHLVLRTLDANLTSAMHRLNGKYAQWWNWRHKRVGHMTQGRYDAQVLDDDAYYLNACRYTVQNPVRSRMVQAAGDWPWSSYRATVGLVEAPEWLYADELLRRFGDEPASAIASYKRFVDNEVQHDHPVGRDVPVLGDEVFRRRFRKDADCASPEVTRWNRLAVKPPLSEIFTNAVTRASRDERIVEAFRLGYNMAEIGRHLELHYSTISRILTRLGVLNNAAKEPVTRRGQALKNAYRQDPAPRVRP